MFLLIKAEKMLTFLNLKKIIKDGEKKVSQTTSQMIFSENIHSNGLKIPMSDCAEQSSVTKTVCLKRKSKQLRTLSTSHMPCDI